MCLWLWSLQFARVVWWSSFRTAKSVRSAAWRYTRRSLWWTWRQTESCRTSFSNWCQVSMKVGSVEKLSAVGFNRVTGLFKPAVVYSYVTTHGKAWQKPLMLKPGKSSEKFFAYVFQQPNSIVASQTKYEVTTKQDVCWQISSTIKQMSVGKS